MVNRYSGDPLLDSRADYGGVHIYIRLIASQSQGEKERERGKLDKL